MQTGAQPTLLFVRIVAVFLLCLAAYYAFAATAFYETQVFRPYVAINADLSGRVLSLLGYRMVVGDATIGSPEFSLAIGPGCDGLEPTALFVAAVLAFVAPLGLKLPALALGVPLLASINLVRIVSLFLVGVYIPDWFHTMHVDVWQVLYIGFAMLFFGLWLVWATRPRGPVADAASA